MARFGGGGVFFSRHLALDANNIEIPPTVTGANAAIFLPQLDKQLCAYSQTVHL